MSDRDPAAAWKRYKNGSGSLHEMTVDIARAIHEERHPRKSWDEDVEIDTWLAVGSWQTAEAVVRVLPLAVDPTARRKVL